MNSVPFDFEIPVSFFEKASAPVGQNRRIGGIISTGNQDRQGETVLTKGLLLDDWLRNGWYNDNHNKETDGIVGYPDSVSNFQKGETLPDGDVAKAAGIWAEGFMLEGENTRAERIWNLGKSLKGTGRRLGFSVEGNIHRRIGPKTIFKKSEKGKGSWVGNTIASATVRNVAITNCPVNTDTGLAILSKSLQAFELAEPTDFEARLMLLEKAMAMGNPTPGVAPVGPQTGEGAGQVVTPESLEQDPKPKLNEKKKDEAEKSLTNVQCVEWFQSHVPGASLDQAIQFIRLSKALKSQGQI